MAVAKSETRGMRIDWDVAIAMDDGIQLRADVFRPIATHDQRRPLKPGEIVRLDIELCPTSIVALTVRGRAHVLVPVIPRR